MRGVVTLAAVFLLPADTEHRAGARHDGVRRHRRHSAHPGPHPAVLVRRLGLRPPTRTRTTWRRRRSTRRRRRRARLSRGARGRRVSARSSERLRQRADRPRPTRCGSGWAGRRRRARSTPAPGRRCSRSSGPRCSGSATRRRSTRACCRACWTRSTSRSRSSTGVGGRDRRRSGRPSCGRVTRRRWLRAPGGVRRRRRRRPRPDGCEECLRDGDEWVHLRLCMECGHVGCCDSSPEQHADRHFERDRSPGDAQLRAGRGLALVLRRQPHRLGAVATRTRMTARARTCPTTSVMPWSMTAAIVRASVPASAGSPSTAMASGRTARP